MAKEVGKQFFEIVLATDFQFSSKVIWRSKKDRNNKKICARIILLCYSFTCNITYRNRSNTRNPYVWNLKCSHTTEESRHTKRNHQTITPFCFFSLLNSKKCFTIFVSKMLGEPTISYEHTHVCTTHIR